MAAAPRRSRIADTWLVEISSIVVSVVSLLAILILLAYYDGKLLFVWHRVTLNTVISIFATISRIALVLAVSASLGQWRWNWFSERPHNLADFDVLDSASRGSLGSFRLLWITKSCALVAIGAWTTIAVVAFDPFVQQLLTYRSDLVFREDSLTHIAYAQRWSRGTEFNEEVAPLNSVTRALDFSTQASISFGLSADTTSIMQQTPSNCSSANCRWAEYMSLGTCSKCFDISNRITTKRINSWPMAQNWPGENSAAMTSNLTRHYLPNGQTIDNTDIWKQGWSGPVSMTARNTARPSETMNFKKMSTLLQAASVLRAHWSGPRSQDWTDVPVTATECALYFCIKKYSSYVTNGTLLETSDEIASTRNPDSWQILQEYLNGAAATGPAADDALLETAHWFPRTDLQILVPPSQVVSKNITAVNVSQPAVDSIIEYVSNMFNDSTSSPNFISFGNTGAVRTNHAADLRIAGNFAPQVMQVLWTTSSLDRTFSNLAASISANMRGTSDQSVKQSGQLGTYETFIEVRWPWITLPCVCIFLGSISLLLTIWQTRRSKVPVWKNSALAVLTHGLDHFVLRSIDHQMSNSGIAKYAEGMTVQFGKDDFKLERVDDGVTARRPASKGPNPDTGNQLHWRSLRSSNTQQQDQNMEMRATTRLLDIR